MVVNWKTGGSDIRLARREKRTKEATIISVFRRLKRGGCHRLSATKPTEKKDWRPIVGALRIEN